MSARLVPTWQRRLNAAAPAFAPGATFWKGRMTALSFLNSVGSGSPLDDWFLYGEFHHPSLTFGTERGATAREDW
jgi:hypothetical protein